ncbi:unnamed protein product, partial [Gongylonema pulchrum]|uniref:ZP domain-containing protein n=1 Tax=Gongylonema pulchrum TaxID=637853 RepID=A0A183CYR3_9BILA
EPHVTCGKEALYVSVPVESPFRGHVFVRGYYSDQKCHKDFQSFNETSGELLMNISFENCGMRRKRQTNPRGVSISSTLVVSFHPKLITAGDRAYQIKCFYMEEQQMVHSDVKFSPMQATEMEMKLPMPNCGYRVLTNGPAGDPVRTLNVGDIVYHSWECKWESHKEGIYCMLLHSCSADDGHGSTQPVVDSHGCSMDEEIFPQIQYSGDLAAGTLMKAFKFADSPNVFFQCQINLSLAVNHSNGTCSVC